MEIYCLSEGELYRIENGKEKRILCERVESYRDAVRKMKARDEWKTTGKGAKFMGVEEKEYGEADAFSMLKGVGACGDKLIYSTYADGVGGMYLKNGDEENYIFANRSEVIAGIDCFDGKCAVSAGNNGYENHIALVNTQNGSFEQLTEGFTSETHPHISRQNSDIIYYTAMGFATDRSGNVVEKSPCSVCMYDLRSSTIDEYIAEDGYDCIKPQDDSDGNMYFIRRKYVPTRKKGNLLLDIVLFPVRIIKAIGGFLSVFSMAFGGEPLRTGGKNPAKSKTANEREAFVEGNLIKAEKQLNASDDEGVIPSDWELVKRSKDGSETVIKKRIMDYRLLDNGDIIYSNGSRIRLISGGKDTVLCKMKLANSITVIQQ